MRIHLSLELPPGTGEAFVVNSGTGAGFGVVLHRNEAMGHAYVAWQNGLNGHVPLRVVAEGAAALEPYRVH